MYRVPFYRVPIFRVPAYRIVVCALLLSAPFCALMAAQAKAGPLVLDPARYAAPGAVAVYAASPPAAEPALEAQPVRLAAAQPNLGGGFIEFLFGGGNGYQPQPQYRSYGDPRSDEQRAPQGEPARPALDPRYLKQTVHYDGHERPGTVIIDTRDKHLFLVLGEGKAIRYGVGVGRPGFLWSGVKQVSQKREWPDWTPPPEMLHRRPDLPRHMVGGPENPLGARAMYLGSSLYRIHGSNEPWTIGTNVSSGCIRMRNEDVIDLYERVKVGTKVVVI
jgi:lipoprotein-anchoring transpeptidase ErfK/SrfK